LGNYIWNKGSDIHFITEFKSGNNFSELELKSLLHQEMIKKGNLTIGSYDFCYSHTENMIDKTISDLEDILPSIKNIIETDSITDHIEGNIVQPIFRKH